VIFLDDPIPLSVINLLGEHAGAIVDSTDRQMNTIPESHAHLSQKPSHPSRHTCDPLFLLHDVYPTSPPFGFSGQCKLQCICMVGLQSFRKPGSFRGTSDAVAMEMDGGRAKVYWLVAGVRNAESSDPTAGNHIGAEVRKAC
jgi:hypothetical protein